MGTRQLMERAEVSSEAFVFRLADIHVTAQQFSRAGPAQCPSVRWRPASSSLSVAVLALAQAVACIHNHVVGAHASA
jgi:hypothetical protein